MHACALAYAALINRADAYCISQLSYNNTVIDY